MGLVSSALNLVGDAPGEECCWLLGSWAGRGWGWLLETGQGPAVDAQTGTGCRLQTLVVEERRWGMWDGPLLISLSGWFSLLSGFHSELCFPLSFHEFSSSPSDTKL